jgi:hypothetical protein
MYAAGFPKHYYLSSDLRGVTSCKTITFFFLLFQYKLLGKQVPIVLSRDCVVTANNYDSLTGLHTPKLAVTAAYIKSSQSLLAVA